MLKLLFLGLVLWNGITMTNARYSKYHRPEFQNSTPPLHGTYSPATPQQLLDNNTMSMREEMQHLINMSMELVRDVNIKERYSFTMQETYTSGSNYQLGLITAGAMGKFETIVKSFKLYCDPRIYEVDANNSHGFTHMTISMYQGLQIMQGEYNKLRLERELFYDYLNNLGTKKKEEDAPENLMPDVLLHMGETAGVLPEGTTLEDLAKLSPEEQRKKIEELMKSKIPKMRRAIKRRNLKPKFRPDAAQEEYKKKLRYRKWAEKWKGYDPKIEGVDINSHLARMGRNESMFLQEY